MAREDLEGQAEPAAQPGVPLSRFRNVWPKIPGRINSVVVPRASTTAGPIRLPRYLWIFSIDWSIRVCFDFSPPSITCLSNTSTKHSGYGFTRTDIDPAKLFRRSLAFGTGSCFDQVLLFHAVASFKSRVLEALLHDLPGKILIHRVLLAYHLRAFHAISI